MNTFEKIEFLLPETISNSFAKSIKTLLIEGTTDNWLEFYGRLKLYLQEHKDTYPHWKSPLHGWINNQRQSYKKGLLSFDRIEKLLELPGWVWVSLDERWLQMLELLKEYFSTHKSLPRQDGKGYSSLANWISNQRKAYNNGTLACEKIKLIEDEFDSWEWDPFADRWLSKFNLVLAYIEENDAIPPARLHHWNILFDSKKGVQNRDIIKRENSKFESIDIWGGILANQNSWISTRN